MLIKKHDKSYIVALEDGSSWRIWPGDIAVTLQWLPTTVLQVEEIDDEFCSHVLIDRAEGARVRHQSKRRLAGEGGSTVAGERVIGECRQAVGWTADRTRARSAG